MWVCPHALKLMAEGARPFCDGCVAVDKMIAQAGGVVVVNEAQLDAMVEEMRRRREIVRSN